MADNEASTSRSALQAVSSDARQLYLLLRCIAFAPRAQVQISQEGIRFSTEETSVMEGFAFLSKNLFTSYQCTIAGSNDAHADYQDDEQASEPASFEISLNALLETLQLFNLADPYPRRDPYSTTVSAHRANPAFDPRSLGLPSICRISYAGEGAPLSIILEESGITTTCSLTTYEPSSTADIPFTRNALSLKIIMRASWLHDAINELSSTSPDRLTLSASNRAPYFSLSASGDLATTTVDFERQEELLETFQIGRNGKFEESYRFDLIKEAKRAMACAAKVSVRGDEQGVLSLQFMIEVEGGKEGKGEVSFVDFRFIPFLSEGNETVATNDREENKDDGTQDE